jgi:apolipoprotein N-acyltransferase
MVTLKSIASHWLQSMQKSAPIIEPAACILLFQAAFRWPGLLGGGLEALAVILLPALLARAAYKGRSLWIIWFTLFVSVMLLTIWMPPTIASKGGIPTALSWFAGLLLWSYDSLPPVLALLLARVFWKRVPGWRGLAAAASGAALAMVACDTWLLHIYPWTWAAALASPPMLGRAAAFLGTEGLTAIIWMHGILAGCFLAIGSKRKVAISTASALALLFALSGAWHFLPRGQELQLDIAIIQPNYRVNTRIPNQLNDMWRRSDALLQNKGLPTNHRPTLLLWPESSATDANYLHSAYDFYLEQMAKGRNVAWLFGTDGWLDSNTPLNIVRGEAEGQAKHFWQAKVVPMPFGERMPGPAWMRHLLERVAGFKSWDVGKLSEDSSFAIPIREGKTIKVHPLICSESLIPSRVRSGLALADGDLLTEHTNDAWFETSIAADLHASMVRLRALETGLPLVRSTLSGRSGWVREDGSWRHISGVMTEGAWSFELKWRPIRTPAKTVWPFYSLLTVLLGSAGLFAWPRKKKKEDEAATPKPHSEVTTIMSVEDIYQRRMAYRKEMAQRSRTPAPPPRNKRR